MSRGRCSPSEDSDADASSDALAGHVTARVETQDGHEECTLFPADAPADELVTTWVTAADDAFVDLAECR